MRIHVFEGKNLSIMLGLVAKALEEGLYILRRPSMVFVSPMDQASLYI